MKSLLQLLKHIFGLYKGASLLLFLISAIQTLNAQSFYFVEGTQITIDETATFFVTDSGKISQARLRNFKEQILTENYSSSETAQLVYNNKKSKLNQKKRKKQSIVKSKKKIDEISQQVRPSEFIKSFSDNFYSSYQQLVAISASGSNITYDPKFLSENIILKLLHGYSVHTNNAMFHTAFIYFKDHHFSQYVIRPPPSEFSF